ncbi:YopX family protein [Brevibacillus brevis]
MDKNEQRSPMWNDWDTLTIIGNIYDNPELLETS